MDKIKFGIVGFGNIGKRHAEHILAHPQAKLQAIASLQEKPNAVSCNYYHSLTTMLANEDLDVVNICTPNYLHAQHCIEVLENKMHAVCEKPMALNSQECESMIQAAQKSNKKLFVVKQNRYNPPVVAVKKLIDENQLGKIFIVNINCFWNRNENYYLHSDWRGKKNKDGGSLYTQFSHFIDIMYYLFGEVKVVSGKIINVSHPYIEIDDTGSFILETLDGAIINFNYSTSAYEKNMEGAISILAENGTVKIGGQYLNTIEYQHVKNVQIEAIQIQAKANDYGLYQGSMSNHDRVIDNVIQHLKGFEAMMTNAIEGSAVVRIIEEMYAMAK